MHSGSEECGMKVPVGEQAVCVYVCMCVCCG